ncbi:RED-like protein N-terminal region-domain-containing protein [Parasitella parasitica]|nr:RED-like protein N-terminal region-domain-containing protein [Parasitella parasitica]
MSEGLSQDDFRRLMATPRRPNNEDTQFKAPAPKPPKNTSAIFAQPRSMRKKNYKKGSNKEEEKQEEKEQSKYRDRAAERRKQGDSTNSDDQPTTEELLQRTQAEAGEELDSKQLYEQSKYLGGDVDHTHLVKGLDFALLRKVRADLSMKQQRHASEQEDEGEVKDKAESKQHPQDMDVDDDLDQILERFERGENIADDTANAASDNPCIESSPKFHTLMAKNIYQYIQHQTNPEEQPHVELFGPGRMAFVFELADEVGHYSDAFAIPTSMIRSKADVTSKLSRSGWSDESQAESSLVIDKISQVMNRLQYGAPVDRIKKLDNTTKILKEPVSMVDDGFMGDIFADAGRDYELDESSIAANTNETRGSYFKDLVDKDEDEEEEEKEGQEMTEASNVAVHALLSQATGITDSEQKQNESNQEATNKRKYNHVEMDADAADIDMFGLSSSALPTSFEEHTATCQSDDDDDGDVNPKQKDRSATQMMDQGTNKNKKAQLTRWDFDTEDEWQNYKDSIEIHPKSAYQYGIKLGDGRKRHKERKGMSDKQRLDRDFQQVKNIMSKKYGKSLDS